VFAQSNGLSGDDVRALFEDREGDVWVSTGNGLDRFRELAVPTFSVNQGLSVSGGAPVLAARDGSVWVTGSNGLSKLKSGQITVYGRRSAASPPGRPATVRMITDSGVPTRVLQSLLQDDRGRLWITSLDGVGYLENDRFISISAISSGDSTFIAK